MTTPPSNKVLAVSAARLGDSLFLTPVFRYFKHLFPNKELEVITQSEIGSNIFESNPLIARVIQQPNREVLKTLKNRYHLGFNVHDSPFARDIYDTLGLPLIQLPRHPLGKHKAEMLLEACSQLTGHDWKLTGGHYDLFPDEDDRTHIADIVHTYKTNKPFIGLHVGCHGLNKGRFKLFGRNTEHKKVWPIKKFIHLAHRLLKTYPQATLILTGSKNEAFLAKKIIAHPRVVSLIGHTSVRQLAALMDELDVYICSDTGPLHVAAAREVNLVALFREAEVIHTGPYPVKPMQHEIIARQIIRDIPIDDVLNAVGRFLPVK